jgi:DNA-binding PadR family transcriptional regulator
MDYDANMLKGVVDPIILKLVSERAMYGYEIIKVINERTKGDFEWKEGTLYPCLHRLEGAGLITSEWQEADSGRQRKYYAITRKGAATLKEKQTEWASFTASVNAVLMAPAM